MVPDSHCRLLLEQVSAQVCEGKPPQQDPRVNYPHLMVNGEGSELAASLLIQGEAAPWSSPRDVPSLTASSDDARKSRFYFLHTFRGG